MNTPELITVIFLTFVIIWLSWHISIKGKRYHGICRFFSFESIAIIVILNYQAWFKHPFSVLQVLSWIFLILSLIMAIIGFGLLREKGKPQGSFENTTELISTGIYKYIRHPLYLSLFLLGTGAMLKDPGIAQAALGLINAVAVYFTARVEEKEMTGRFGEPYRRYMLRTKMFIPCIF